MTKGALARHLRRIWNQIALLKGENKNMHIATSNLTNAIAALGTRLDLVTAGFQEFQNDLKAELLTVTNSNDDVEVQASADKINDDILPRFDAILAGLQTAASSITELGKQMPTGSTAATTGAVQTTDGGKGVAGVGGALEDSSSGANTSTGTTPSDIADNNAIIGNKPEDLAPGNSQAPASKQPVTTGEEAPVAGAPEAGNQSA